MALVIVHSDCEVMIGRWRQYMEEWRLRAEHAKTLRERRHAIWETRRYRRLADSLQHILDNGLLLEPPKTVKVSRRG